MISDQTRVYPRATSITFLKTNEAFGGLSNMASGFPVIVNGFRIRTCEALYQACRFPHKPDVQRRIIAESSPMTAKMRSKAFRKVSRSDWLDVRVPIMRWCLRVKLAQNWRAFSELLLKTGDRAIVEQSRKDDFWGAKPIDEQTLAGMNVLGQLLMELRELVKAEGRASFLRVQPPTIADFKLGGRPIEIVTGEDEKMAISVQYGAPIVPHSGVGSLREEQQSLFETTLVHHSPQQTYHASGINCVHIADLVPYPDYKESGFTYLGKVPEHWEVAMVKQNYTIQLGKMLQNEAKASDDIEIPYLKAQHVQWFNVRTTDAPKMWASQSDISKFGVAPSDLLVCEGGEGGRCGILKQQVNNCIIQNALHRIRPREQSRNDFLQYVMSSVAATGWLDALNDKATIAHFTREKFGALRVPIPPLIEQTAIVRFLDHADRLIQRYIRAKQKLIALLSEQRKNATQKTIQSPNTIDQRLEVVADLVKRPIDRVSNHSYTPIGLYNRGRGIFLKESRRGNDLGDSDFFWIEDGDLVISGQFAWEGAIALARDAECGCVASHRYPILRGKPDVLDSGFLLAYFQTDWGQLLLDHHSRGAAGRNRPLNVRTLMKERITLPPLQSQLRIVEMLRREFRVRQQADTWKRMLNEYRTRLIADVVTGKVDVREAATTLPQVDPLADDDELDEPIDADAEANSDRLEAVLEELEA